MKETVAVECGGQVGEHRSVLASQRMVAEMF